MKRWIRFLSVVTAEPNPSHYIFFTFPWTHQTDQSCHLHNEVLLVLVWGIIYLNLLLVLKQGGYFSDWDWDRDWFHWGGSWDTAWFKANWRFSCFWTCHGFLNTKWPRACGSTAAECSVDILFLQAWVQHLTLQNYDYMSGQHGIDPIPFLCHILCHSTSGPARWFPREESGQHT